MITVEELHVAFSAKGTSTTVVDGISFAAQRGETVGIVGESGCGKSTVLRCLSGLERRWTGRISLDGHVMDQVRTRDRLRAAQMVFQDPYGSIHPRHRIGRILAEPALSMGEAGAWDRVPNALERVGLPAAFAERFPHELSGGQRQRVAIARALVLRPPVLLLDEPTSALDVSVQAEVLNLLVDLQEQDGLTYVFVSHDLAVVGHMCDRIFVMRDGVFEDELTRADMAAHRTRSPYAADLLASSYL